MLKRKNLRTTVRNLLVAGAMAVMGGATAVPQADSDFFTLEMLSWTPDRLEEQLEKAKVAYRGEHPDDLLVLLSALQKKQAASGKIDPSLRPGETFAACSALLVDMFDEWPSAKAAATILQALHADSPSERWAGLAAAGAVADRPAVRKRLIEIARKRPAPKEVDAAVRAILALGRSNSTEALTVLAEGEKATRTAVREASCRAAQTLRVSLGRQKVPPLGPTARVPTATVIGTTLFGDYRSLPVAPVGTAGVKILTVTLGPRNRRPFTPEVLAAMSNVLGRGGTVLIDAPKETGWPKSLINWAAAHSITLPSHRQRAFGPGIPCYAHYRLFVDFPFALLDQPGDAAAYCWQHWGEEQKTPVLSADRAGALVVVQDQVLGKGRLLFTTIDLTRRPIYRENILRWLYGDALISRPYLTLGDYDFREGGHTPHQVWAKPLAGGRRPKVLYLSSSLTKRGLLELIQRMDMEWRFVPYDASFALPPDKEKGAPARMGQRAVCLLDEYLDWADLLVFDVSERNLLKSLSRSIKGTVSLDLVPSRLRRRIYRRVHAGKLGLLGVSSPRATESCIKEFVARIEAGDDRDRAASALTARMLPFAKPAGQGAYGGPPLHSAVVGQGRMAWFSQRLPHIAEGDRIPELAPGADYTVPGLLQARSPLRTEEYAYALLVGSVLQIAGYSPVAKIHDLVITGEKAGAPVTLAVTLNHAFNGTVAAVVRDRYNRTSQIEEIPIHGKTTRAALPELPAGPRVLEIRLKDAAGGIVDFATREFRLHSAVTIKHLDADKRFYHAGEKAVLTVRLSAPFSGEARVQATDTWGRRVFKSTRILKRQSDSFSLTVPIRFPRSRLWDIEVTLFSQGHPISRLIRPIGIALPAPETDFDVTASFYRSDLIPFFQQQMGVTVTYGDPEQALRHNLNLSSGAWSTPIGASPEPGERVNPRERQPCLSSPSFRLRAIRDMRKQGPLFRDLGITDYMISDECPLGGRCFARDTLVRFREWLRDRYKGLNALNREWGTTYQSWAAVTPLTGASPERPGAMVDFDVFTRWVFAEYSSFLELIADDYIGDFRAGQSGGLHGNLMMNESGALYYYGVIESAVSMKRPGAMIGSWYAPGYRFREDHETQARHWPWWHLFRGTTRMQLWYPKSGPPAYHGDLSRPYKAFVWLNEEMADIRSGIGKLLLHARRDEGRVAIYASQRTNLVFSALTEIRKQQPESAKGRAKQPRLFMPLRPAPPRAGNNLQKRFLDRQVECRFISEYQVERGELAARGVKLLILPSVISLSAKERDAIRRFVRNGGVAVADAGGVGLRNAHGTWTGTAFTQELFGAAGKKKSGGAPAFSIQSYGKGKAVLLPFVLTKKALAAGAPDQGWIDDLLTLAGVVPTVRVEAQGLTIPGVDFGHFYAGNALYFGFVTRGKGGMVADEKTQTVTVTFPEKRHLYDARHGRYLGERKAIETPLTPSIAQVYAALPGKVTAIDIPAVQPSCRPGDPIKFKLTARVQGPAPGLQVWRVTVAGPDGKSRPAQAQRLLVKNGAAQLLIPLALNAQPGVWTLTVRDAATGVEGHQSFTVEAQP